MGFLQDRSASLHPVEAQGVTVAIPSCHLEPLVYSYITLDTTTRTLKEPQKVKVLRW